MLLALALCALVSPAGAADVPAQTTAVAAPTDLASPAVGGKAAGQRPRPGSIDYQVQLLTAELKLDPGQQVKVRQILEDQRRQTIGAWNNDAVPAAVRVHTTQIIGEQTADRIRAVLNDEQREKYMKPRHANSDQTQSAEKVDSWINAVGSH